MTGNRIAQMPPQEASAISFTLARFSRSGLYPRRRAVIEIAIASAAHIIRPGMMPAANSRPIETCPTVP